MHFEVTWVYMPIFRTIDGIVLLNKPQNMTSFFATQQVKKIFCATKAGHTGSLDPIATGMLAICLGEATKFSQYILGLNKTYLVTGQLGHATTTGDKTGTICKTGPASCPEAVLRAILQQFLGQRQQIPPMYSALKYKGIPLYHYARQGQMINRVPRTIYINQIELLSLHGHLFTLRAEVSKGTYIRTLVEDIGLAVGSCAHVQALHRLSISGFESDTMSSLFELAVSNAMEKYKKCLPIERAVEHMKAISISPAQKQSLYQGKTIKWDHPLESCQTVSLWDEHAHFIGVGQYHPEGLLSVRKLRGVYAS